MQKSLLWIKQSIKILKQIECLFIWKDFDKFLTTWIIRQILTYNTLDAKNPKHFGHTLRRAQLKRAQNSTLCMSNMEKIWQELKEEVHFKQKFMNKTP